MYDAFLVISLNCARRLLPIRRGRAPRTSGPSAASGVATMIVAMTSSPATPLLIETAVPQPDAVLAVHAVVHADPASTFAAARSLDFLTVRTPLLLAAMWVRGLPSRLRGTSAAPAKRLTVAQGTGLPGWLLLGEKVDEEIAFGAVGTFWQPAIQWHDVPRDQFAAFGEPGWGKIAANFSVAPYGTSTLLTYECRTVTTDPVSRRRFLRYWWVIRPFVGHIMRATVATVVRDAEARASAAATADTVARGRG